MLLPGTALTINKLFLDYFYIVGRAPHTSSQTGALGHPVYRFLSPRITSSLGETQTASTFHSSLFTTGEGSRSCSTQPHPSPLPDSSPFLVLSMPGLSLSWSASVWFLSYFMFCCFSSVTSVSQMQT